MRRLRSLLPSLALCAFAALALAGCATVDKVGALVANRIAFDAEDLQAYLDRQYPRDYAQLGGLASLRILEPRVAIPEGDNALHLDFDVGIEGLGMRGEKPVGHFAVASGLRYDAARQALMKAELERILASGELSSDVYEVVSKSLA